MMMHGLANFKFTLN